MVSATAAAAEGRSCWICLEGGADCDGRPLTRNCACRGDSGWAHVACLARFAKARTDDMTAGDYSDMIQSCRGTPWSVCQTCRQDFHGHLATALARKWVDAVADLDAASPQSIAAKINFATLSMKNRAHALGIKKWSEIRQNLIWTARSADGSHASSKFFALAEIHCLANLSLAYWHSGKNEWALEYASQLKSLDEKTGWLFPGEVESIFSMIEESIAGQNGKEGIKAAVKIFTSMHGKEVQMNGRDSRKAINLSVIIADNYVAIGQSGDSLPWYKDAYNRTKRVFGASHPEYISIKKKFLLVNASLGPRRGTLTMKDPRLDGRAVTIIRATKDGKKYIVDIGGSDAAGSPRRVKATPSQLVFAHDTHVTMDECGDSLTAYVDSFDEKTESYKVFATSGAGDGQHQFLDVSRKDVRVAFAHPSTRQVGT